MQCSRRRRPQRYATGIDRARAPGGRTRGCGSRAGWLDSPFVQSGRHPLLREFFRWRSDVHESAAGGESGIAQTGAHVRRLEHGGGSIGRHLRRDVYRQLESEATECAAGLVCAVSPAETKEFTAVRSLNGRPSEGFSLAADGKGRLTATWLANKLYANLSTDEGRTFTPNAELDPAYDPCECCTTRSVNGPNGDLAILYREKSNNDRDMCLVIQDRAGHLTPTPVSSTLWHVNACPMTYYALTSTNDGYLAAWPTKGDIYFARLNRDGIVLPPCGVKTPGHSAMQLRRTHMYLGLFLTPWLTMYALSTVVFNHWKRLEDRNQSSRSPFRACWHIRLANAGCLETRQYERSRPGPRWYI